MTAPRGKNPDSLSSRSERPLSLIPTPEGVLIDLWVQPGARKTTWSGYHGQQLKLSVQSPPVEGAANQDCIGFLSRWFGLKRSQVDLVKGEKSRSKVFLLKGLSLENCRPLIPDPDPNLYE